MSEQGNWKIRVGGEYMAENDIANRHPYLRVVTAIVGDSVYYALRTYHDHTVPPGYGDLHDPGKYMDYADFQKASIPEDQSPIPYLVAALKAVEWGGVEPTLEARTLEAKSFDAEAIKKLRIEPASFMEVSSLHLACPACQRSKSQGHADGCAVAEALGKAGAL